MQTLGIWELAYLPPTNEQGLFRLQHRIQSAIGLYLL